LTIFLPVLLDGDVALAKLENLIRIIKDGNDFT
jgi:hypothetical protein